MSGLLEKRHGWAIYEYTPLQRRGWPGHKCVYARLPTR